MNQAISVELQFFLISILWGALLLLIYDVLRILRRLIKHDDFLVALEDLIFWVFASLFIFIMMYKENNGIIRGFSIMGMAIGIAVYHFILSDFIVDYITKIIRALLSPLVFVIKQAIKIGKLVMNRVKKVLNHLNKRLKKWEQSVRIKLSAKRQLKLEKRQKLLEEKQKIKKRADDIKQAKKKAKEKKELQEKQSQQEKKKDHNKKNKR
jgi:Predicted membrane protein